MSTAECFSNLVVGKVFKPMVLATFNWKKVVKPKRVATSLVEMVL